jgi:hypothetical protein
MEEFDRNIPIAIYWFPLLICEKTLVMDLAGSLREERISRRKRDQRGKQQRKGNFHFLLDFLTVFFGEFFLDFLAGLLFGDIFLDFLAELFLAAWLLTPDAGAIGAPGGVVSGGGRTGVVPGLLSNGYKMSTAPAVTALVEKGDPTEAWA